VACRKAIGLKRDYASAHAVLGMALERTRRLDEALAAYKECLAISPDHPMALLRLGVALDSRGELPGAVACYRRAAQSHPKLAEAHYNLGSTLHRQGDLPAAADCFRRAIEINPKYAEAHSNLGDVLLRQGDFRAALGAMRTGHDLGSRRKDWPYPSDQWVQLFDNFLQLEGHLPALLKGEEQPTGVERIHLAELCRYKRLYGSSARFYLEALDANAGLADGNRYPAACAAALAGCGEGRDGGGGPDKARASLRKQALEWLRAALAGWARRREGGTPQDRAEVRTRLSIWQVDPALSGVRDAGPLAVMPPTEREAWQRLWADVAATLAKFGETK
jgi:tetratricopeptide (TPR) repeat protein